MLCDIQIDGSNSARRVVPYDTFVQKYTKDSHKKHEVFDWPAKDWKNDKLFEAELCKTSLSLCLQKLYMDTPGATNLMVTSKPAKGVYTLSKVDANKLMLVFGTSKVGCCETKKVPVGPGYIECDGDSPDGMSMFLISTGFGDSFAAAWAVRGSSEKKEVNAEILTKKMTLKLPGKKSDDVEFEVPYITNKKVIDKNTEVVIYKAPKVAASSPKKGTKRNFTMLKTSS